VKQVVIENPVINSPYDEPKRHFKFTEEGITDEIIEGIRRPSSYFIPIARPRSRGRQAQLHLDTEWTEDRLKENDEINSILVHVSLYGGRAAMSASRRPLPDCLNIGTILTGRKSSSSAR